ncbi:MAG: hypothetical protein NTZ35_02820 [Ignavibacteriales bacterium]|nr:hypothetical protein [Ignavibacteriales bacterium]
MIKSASIMLVVFLCHVAALSQTVEKVMTPDDSLNSVFNDFNITTTKLIRFEEISEGMILDFRLPSDWTFIAGKNLRTKSGRVDFAFYNGVLYSNSKDTKYVSFKSQVYPELFTDQIQSNVFAIGFKKADQAAIFVVAQETAQATIKVDRAVLGRQLCFDFPLAKNECKLIRIMKNYPPYLPR